MAQFSYKALTVDGKLTTGELTANDRGEALKSLDKKGLRPTKLRAIENAPAKQKSTKEKATSKPAKKTRAKVAPKEKQPALGGELKLKKQQVILFTEELSDMLSAGLQLEPALRSMENRQESGNLQAVSEQVRSFVRDGNTFSSSLQRVSKSFGPLYCSMAAAGEASGALDTILKRQAHYLKTLNELQTKVTLALIYPAFLVLAGIGVSFVFVTKLIPQLTSLLESTPGAEIPLGARVLIAISGFFTQWWWAILAGIILIGLAFKMWKDKDENRPVWDRFKLNAPLVGRVIEDRFYVQFLETMSNLVGNGLTLLRSLELTRNATQNLHIRSHLNEIIEQVGDGRSLSSSLIKSDIFPPLLVDMVSVGEQTGQIDVSLRKAAERYDKELNKSLQKIMALIMPAVLIVMAGLIGMMAYLMLTAIFQTIQSLG